ncbi:hypothetical protein ACFTXJ_14100 [Streptomyces zhihengii]|uniref:hypothetical protein n=1 Tax=Streptomyces zhihengii TaxID=1818004 RepID=UPI0036300B5C
MSDRYHLQLTIDGRPVMHAWWSTRVTADRKMSAWIGDYGTRDGVRVTLTDTVEGREIAAWPG